MEEVVSTVDLAPFGKEIQRGFADGMQVVDGELVESVKICMGGPKPYDGRDFIEELIDALTSGENP